MKTLVFISGRFNPMTVAHEAMIDFAKKFALQKKATLFVHTTKSEDRKKNPIPFNDKVKYIEEIFKINITGKEYPNAIKYIESIASDWDKIYFIVGSDRLDDFQKTMKKYFDNVEVIDWNKGKRVPGVSGTQQREYAKDKNYEKFLENLPSYARSRKGLARAIYFKVRMGLGLAEKEEIKEEKKDGK